MRGRSAFKRDRRLPMRTEDAGQLIFSNQLICNTHTANSVRLNEGNIVCIDIRSDDILCGRSISLQLPYCSIVSITWLLIINNNPTPSNATQTASMVSGQYARYTNFFIQSFQEATEQLHLNAWHQGIVLYRFKGFIFKHNLRTKPTSPWAVLNASISMNRNTP